MIACTGSPLELYEVDGDAVTFCAIEDDGEDNSATVLAQVERCMDTFREREAELISEASICLCDACKRVDQLKFKIVVHRGLATFMQVRGFNKVGGEDIIMAHRLLKNDVPSDEYILMTEPFVQSCPDSSFADSTVQAGKTNVDGFGEVPIKVIDYNRGAATEPKAATLGAKLKMFGAVELHLLKRLISKSTQSFASLQDL